MKLLVAGADRVDAGKTTFTVGLLDRLDAAGYKPRAGNDYWFDHDDYRHAVADGRLYGKDAKRIAAVIGSAPERVNPVHRLWTPSPGPRTGLLGRDDQEFLVDRVGPRPAAGIDGTAAAEESTVRYVVNGTVELPASCRDALPLDGDDVVVVDSLEELNEVMEGVHLPALAGLADRIDEHERAVVESYADIALPIRGFDPDAVAVVEPRRARVFDGERYAKACAVASGSAQEGRLEERVPQVLEFLEPLATAELPALTAEQRDDPGRIAASYEPAYEAFVAAALE